MTRIIIGQNDAQIAHEMGIAVSTVAQYMRNVCQKLRARNRVTAAVHYYLHYGMPEQVMPLQPMTEMEPLTEQEQRIIELLAKGHSEREIAHRLAVSKSTVTQHLLSVRHKLDAPNRVAAAVEYYRQLGRTSRSSESEHTDER